VERKIGTIVPKAVHSVDIAAIVESSYVLGHADHTGFAGIGPVVVVAATEQEWH